MSGVLEKFAFCRDMLLLLLLIPLASCDFTKDDPVEPQDETITRSWSEMTTPAAVDVLTSVWGAAENDVYAAGTGGVIFHFDGNAWNEMNSGVTENILGIWGRDEFYVNASTDHRHVVLFSVGVNTIPGTYDVVVTSTPQRAEIQAGTSQTAVLGQSETITLNGVAIFLTAGMSQSQVRDRINEFNASTNASAAIEEYKLALSTDALGEHVITAVSNVPSRGESSGLGTTVLVGSGRNVVGTIGGFAAAGNGDLLSGAAGTSVEDLTVRISETAEGPLGSVTLVRQTRVIRAVGSGGLIIEGDGAEWTRMANNSGQALYGIWGTSGSRTRAVGDETLLEFGDWSWDSDPTAPGQSWAGERFHDIWGNSSSDVFAVGTNGTIIHHDGISWELMTSGTDDDLHGVWGSSGTNVFAVGRDGTVLRFNGSQWSPMSSGTTYPLLGIWGRSYDDVFAVGSYGTILHFDGSVWTTMTGGTDKSLRSLWGDDSAVYAVGEQGIILRYGPVTL